MSHNLEAVRVLHVDDDRDFLDVTKRFLEKETENLAIETALGANEGRECLRAGRFDCLISDYDMPDSTGVQFLKTVREEYPDLPFILFTGKGSEKVAAEAISAGATEYIQKKGSASQYTVLANRIFNLVEQYRANCRSERANRRRRRTLERITDGFIELDAELTISDVNNQTVELTGLSRERLLGTTYQELMAETAPGTVLDAYREVLETGAAQTVEAPSDIYPERWHQERVFPTEEGDGIFVYFHDITERKRRERLQTIIIEISSRLINASAVEIDARIEGALERIGAFEGADRSYIFEIYENGQRMDNTYEWCAPGIESHKPELQNLSTAEYSWFMPKIEADETVTVPDAAALPEEASHLRGVLQSGNIKSIVTIPLTRGGTLLGFIGFDWTDKQGPWSQDTIDLLEVSGNIIANALARKETIRERKRREETLSELHTTAREIGRADNPSVVYETLVDASERILGLDYASVDIVEDGYLVQKNILQIEKAKHYERASLAEEDTLAAKAYNQQETLVNNNLRETEYVADDLEFRAALTVPIGEFGTFQTVATRSGVFDDQDQEFIELLVDHARVKLNQLMDKQSLQNRTADLERKNERLEELASLIGHDLRNPLNTLELSLESAKRTNEPEHFERSERAVERMQQLLEDLLMLARQGNEIDDPELISLAAATESAWETVDTEDGTLVVATDQILLADRTRLIQLLENLFHNAVEHGSTTNQLQSTEGDCVHSQETDLTVTVGDCPGGFYVADDGVGIAPDERETVFETGYSTTDGGTGFGLSIVEEIVEAHDWDISITDSEDDGARFEITSVETHAEES